MDRSVYYIGTPQFATSIVYPSVYSFESLVLDGDSSAMDTSPHTIGVAHAVHVAE